MRLRWFLADLPDAAARWVAFRLPRRVVYWCAIRVGVHASTGPHSRQVVPELTVGDLLQRWT